MVPLLLANNVKIIIKKFANRVMSVIMLKIAAFARPTNARVGMGDRLPQKIVLVARAVVGRTGSSLVSPVLAVMDLMLRILRWG